MSVNLISAGTLLEYFDFIAFSIMYRHIPFIQGSGIFVQFVLGYGSRFIGSLAVLRFTKNMEVSKILALSIISISVSTILIGLLPNQSYSFHLLILLRAIQSIAFAVEFPTGSAAFKQEKHSSSVVSAATQGYIFASLLCSLLFSFLDPNSIRSVGWRIPFLLGGGAGIVLSILRFRHWLQGTDLENTPDNGNKIFALVGNIVLFASLVISYLLLIFGKPHFSASLDIPNIAGLYSKNSSKTLMLGLSILPLFLLHKLRWSQIPIRIAAYIVTLKYSITHSMVQSYIVSSSPILGSVNTISLIFSALFAQLGHVKIFNIKLSSIPLLIISFTAVFSILTGTNVLEMIYMTYIPKLDPVDAMLVIFVLNQMFITSLMINSISNSKEIFRGKKYLIPPVYNFITFASAWLLNTNGLLRPNYLAGLFRTTQLSEVLKNPQVVASISMNCLSSLVEGAALVFSTFLLGK